MNLNCECGELDVVVQDTNSSRKRSSLLEVNLIHIGPCTSESLLLHVRRQQTGRGEADLLRDNGLALTLASQCERTSDRHADYSLLGRGNATEVEALQGEVGRLAARGLESCGVVEAGAENVLHCNVGLRLCEDSGWCTADVDDVEAVPGKTFVSANGLQGCNGDGDCDIVELEGVSGTNGYVAAISMLTFAVCCWRPMLAALATMAGMARMAENFMVNKDVVRLEGRVGQGLERLE